MKRLALAVAALLCLLMPATALAYDPLDSACAASSAAKNSATCDGTKTSKDPIGGPNGVLKRVSLVIATIAGVAAVIVIVVSGLMLVLSGGDSQKAAGARSAIIGAVVGLVIIAVSESLIVFVVSRT
jgi:hypothetical protein